MTSDDPSWLMLLAGVLNIVFALTLVWRATIDGVTLGTYAAPPLATLGVIFVYDNYTAARGADYAE